MNKLFINFLIFLIFTSATLAQAPTQKDILGLPNIDLVNDYNYNIAKKIPSKVVSKNFQPIDGKFVKIFTAKYLFDTSSLKIKEFKYIDGVSTMEHSYNYKKKLLHEYSLKENEKVLQNRTYIYDENKRVLSVKNQAPNFKSTLNYSYPNNNQIIKDATFKFTLKNGLIIKSNESNPKVSKEYITDYEYDDKNLLTEKAHYEKFLNVFVPSNLPTVGYRYNNAGHLISETSIASFDDMLLLYFEYIYDDYGNWIARFKIRKKDIFDAQSKVIIEIHIRNIEYSDKTTTGFTSTDNKQIQEYLAQKKFETTEAPKDGVYFSKSSNTSVKLYLNGENISGRLKGVEILGNAMFANDSVSNIFYQLKDFKSKPIKKEYYKATVFAVKGEMVWVRYKDKSYTYYIIGNDIKKGSTKLIFAKNKEDVTVKIEGIPKYVFLNSNNIAINTYQKAISYSEYLKTHPNEKKKEVVENIPSGNIWEKSENGGFIYYANRENRSQKINYTFFGDHCIIYDLTNKKSYLIKDLKTKATGDFNNTIALKGNVFWLKLEGNSYSLIINARKIKSNAIYAQNGIDVIITNNNEEKEYVLKNYTNAAQNKLLPVSDYANYTEKPSSEYVLNEKVTNCNADKKCLASLYNETYDKYYDNFSKDQLAQKMADYIVKVYNVHPHLAFTVLMTNKRNIDVIKPLMEKLPEKVRTSIRSGSQKILDDYNKYINSKKVRDKVKEYGGGYIKSKN